jgi:hypothetical protein
LLLVEVVEVLDITAVVVVQEAIKQPQDSL